MNFFVCLVRLSGAPVTAADRERMSTHLASRGIGGLAWEGDGSLCALVARTGARGPALVNADGLVGVGDVRLDNPDEIARELSGRPAPATHLGLAVRWTGARGPEAAGRLLGDFAFVAWDPAARLLVAVRDAFGVKPLFQARIHPDLLAFASHASLLGVSGRVSEGYIARYFVRSLADEEAIFAGVEVVPAAHTLTVADGRLSPRRYWSPDSFDTDLAHTGPTAVEELRGLFAEAVRLRLGGRGPVWSELSGGLDTSSVVSMAAWLHRAGAASQGVAGTVTYADSLGSGDEHEFVDAVLESSGVRHEQIRDCWPWQDDGGAPFRTEMPGPVTLMWARDRWRDDLLRQTRAEALLSGYGGDHVLEGNLFFFADWVAAGSVRRACGELARWAALRQDSFWKFAWRHALMPLLPAAVRLRLATGGVPRIPAWVPRGSRRRFNLHAYARQAAVPRPTAGTLPWYHWENAELVRFLPRSLPRPHPFVTYERRFPFLYRPLVELALRLPPELKVSPGARKVALREAMRGVLPETVRTRLGKGGIGSRMLWSLNHERRRIEAMLRDPVLAQMGFVDAAALRRAYHDARAGAPRLTVSLFRTLALETWLLIEAGRWPLPEGAPTSPIQTLKERSHGHHQAAVSGAGPR